MIYSSPRTSPPPNLFLPGEEAGGEDDPDDLQHGQAEADQPEEKEVLGELVREPVPAAGVGDVAGVVPGAAPGALRLAAGVGHLRPLALPPSPPVAGAATPRKAIKIPILFTYQQNTKVVDNKEDL